MFHLCEEVDDPSLLNFRVGAKLFNGSVMPSILDSMVVRRVLLLTIGDFLNGVVREVIVRITAAFVRVHVNCGCVVKETVCSRCSVTFDDPDRRDLRMEIMVEDGSVEPVMLYTLASSVDLFGHDADGWEAQLSSVREKMTAMKCGSELVFVVSRCPGVEFGLVDTVGEMCRADAAVEGREETVRAVRSLAGVLEDDTPYTIRFTGD
jgi:hypothetical protein